MREITRLALKCVARVILEGGARGTKAFRFLITHVITTEEVAKFMKFG
jgi:hypothetical protein